MAIQIIKVAAVCISMLFVPSPGGAAEEVRHAEVFGAQDWEEEGDTRLKQI